MQTAFLYWAKLHDWSRLPQIYNDNHRTSIQDKILFQIFMFAIDSWSWEVMTLQTVNFHTYQ